MKKKISIYFTGALFVLNSLSCTKDNNSPIGTSSLTIVNSIVGSSALVTNFASNLPLQYYNTSQRISSNSYVEFGEYSGNIALSLSQISDTTHTVYNGTISLPINTIHTLFLTGTVASPDSFFSTDSPVYHAATDSAVSIRFVNISSGSNPVSVNIRGNAAGSEVTSLNYKGITAFKSYTANSTVASYIFEFRDAGTGALLASYTMSGVNNGTGKNTSTNQFIFKSVTIALTGLPGSQGTLLIKDY